MHSFTKHIFCNDRGVQQRQSRQAGFSLLEVLISIIILSFGLLGMVGLQAAALKSNRSARLQSEALTLTRELAEMMRANPAIAVQTTNNPYLGDFSAGSMTPSRTSNCLDIGSSCATQEDVAAAQMTEWLARANDRLPSVRVAVCFDNAPYDGDGLPQWACSNSGDILTIKVGWTREDTQGQIVTATDADARPDIVLPVTPGGQL